MNLWPRFGIIPHWFLKGSTHKRGAVETPGRKPIFSLANVVAMNKKRKHLVKKAKGDKYVTWDAIRKASRLPEGDRTTVAKDAFVSMCSSG